MTMIRFIKFIDKLMDLTKKRTVRKVRKCNCGASIMVLPKRFDEPVRYKREECICQIKKGDKLQVYILLKLGEATVTQVKKLVLAEFTDEDAEKDGFEGVYDFEIGLGEMHGSEFYSEEFRVIDFEPDWKPQEIKDV